ncbi:hypothetical protein BKA69DRAFT_722748 [Paraphysoderma sedebokerense]|nr:hypothetical protein BKA69DRAFT_722748 [Paraphysoderma sedebokerense]
MSPIPSQTAFADPHEHANLDTSQNELKHVDSAATAFCENTSKEMAEETDANVALLVNEDESMPQENEKRGQLDQTSHSFELDSTVTAAASKISFNNVGDVAYEPDSSISINHHSDGNVEESPSFVASKKPKSKRRIIDISSDEEDELKVPSAPADCCPQVHHLGSDTNTPCKESSAHSNQIYPLAVIPSTPPATETVQQEEPFFTPAGSFSPFKAATKKKVAVVIRRQSSLRHEITSAIKSGDLFDFLHSNTYASRAVENSSVQVGATVTKSVATQKSTTTVSGSKTDGTLQRQVYRGNDESDEDEPVIRRTPLKPRRRIIEDLDDNEDEDVEASQGKPLDDTLIDAFNRSSINTQRKEKEFEDEESPFNPGVIVFDGGRKKPAAITSKNPRDPYHFSADESSASSVPRSKSLLSEVFSTPPTKVATPTKYFTPSQTSSPQVSKAKREFIRNRETITLQLYKEYNERIFKNQLPEKLDIIWSAKLNTTAGRTYTRRVKRGNGEWSYSASVELSTKVLDES